MLLGPLGTPIKLDEKNERKVARNENIHFAG